MLYPNFTKTLNVIGDLLHYYYYENVHRTKSTHTENDKNTFLDTTLLHSTNDTIRQFCTKNLAQMLHIRHYCTAQNTS